MFVDASALAATLLGEPDATALTARLEAADGLFTSPIATFETVFAVMRSKRLSRANAEGRVRAAVATAGIEVVAIADEIGRAALDAYERYGKGRGHPAQLNLGDCFASGAGPHSGCAPVVQG